MPLQISRDPTGAAGVDIFELDPTLTIQQNIERHAESGYGARLWVNGALIDRPEECADLDRMATVFDNVAIEYRPEGTVVLIALAISLIVSAASYFLLPKPTIPNDMGAGKDSPNNRLTSQTNIARAYQAIPDIYGRVRAYPDLIQQSVVEYINHVKYVTEWVCVGRGWYDISDVKYAETPLSDINGASYEIFQSTGGTFPEYGVTTVNDIIESFKSPEVNGQELSPAVPYSTVSLSGMQLNFTASSTDFVIRSDDKSSKWNQLIELFPNNGSARVYAKDSGPAGVLVDEICNCISYTSDATRYYFTLRKSSAAGATSSFTLSSGSTIKPNKSATNPTNTFTLPTEANRIRWNTVFLRGLVGSVQIRATWFAIDSNGDEIAGSRQSQVNTYTANTYDQRFWTATVIPSYGTARYRVFFERITADLGNGADIAKLEELFALKYYQWKNFTGVTVMRLTTQATEQATGWQDRKFNCMVTRHVREFDTNHCRPSRSFARAIVHSFVVIARRNIAQLDIDALRLVESQAPGELGYFDFSFDDKDISLASRMQTAANVARCLVFRDGLKWSFVRDQANPIGAMVQFDYRNLSAGGDGAITYRGHLPTSYDSVELEYVDPTDNKKALVKLRIHPDGTITAGTGNRASKIQLAGCRNVAQATNRAYLEAAKIVYQRESVSDTALSDASLVNIGDIVRWVDPADFYGDDGLQSGEVLAIAGSTITTSEPIHWNGATTGRAIFTLSNGASASPVTITPRTDGVNGFIAGALPSGIFTADGSDIQLGSRYAVGVGLSESAINAAGLYTLTSKAPNPDGTIGVELAKYDSRIYQYD